MFDNSGFLDSADLNGFKEFIQDHYSQVSPIIDLNTDFSKRAFSDQNYLQPLKLKIEKCNKYTKDNIFYTISCCLMLLSGIMLFVLLALCQKIVKMHSFFKRQKML